MSLTIFFRHFVKCRDALSECEKGLIYLNGLFLTLSLHVCETLSLWSSQIHQLKLTYNDIVRVIGVHLFQCYCENWMRSGWWKVHFVWANGFIFYSFMEKLHYMFVWLALKREQILDYVVIIVVPLQFQSCWVILCWIEGYGDQERVSWLRRFCLVLASE